MVTRAMTRRRKLAQTKCQSVYPSSRSLSLPLANSKPSGYRKRWKGDGAFSSKMVISSDMPAAFTQPRAKKIIKVSRVSPKLDHHNFSGYTNDQQEDSVERAVSTVRQPLTTRLEVTGEVSSSKPLASDTFLEIHNQVGEWYAGVVEPSSPGSETAQASAQTSDEVLQRLDLSSDPWKTSSVDDKARRSSTSSSCDIVSSHRQFEHIREISCKYPAAEKPHKSELLRLIDEGLLVDINAKTSRDPFDGKYWNDGLNVDLHGSHYLSQIPELNQQRREFPEEQFRYRGSRLPRHSQVLDPMLVEIPCSPKMSTRTHLNSWQPDRESISLHPTSQTTMNVKNKRLASTPSDCALNLNDAFQKSFLAICLIAATDDEDCSSTMIRHHAKKFSTQELLEPWKNFQDHDHSPQTSPGGLFMDFTESRDHLFGLPISTDPNELIFTTLAQPGGQPSTHRANPGDELYGCNWETTPAASLDCPGTAFNSTDNWKLVDDPEEHSEFPPLPRSNFGTVDYEEEGEPQSFHFGSSDPFAFTSFEGPADRLSSPARILR